MKMMLPSFDPTATMSGTVRNPLPQNQQVNGSYGYLLWANESSVSLIINVNNNNFRIHPWELAKIDFDEATQMIGWAVEVVLSNAASAPISLCLIDAYTPDEVISAAFPIPLVRNTNVGGVVNASNVATLINNGSAPGTLILQTTPTGQATAAVQFDNSGNLAIRTLSNNVWTTIFQIVAGSNVAAAVVTALFPGADMQINSLKTVGTHSVGGVQYAIEASGASYLDNGAIKTSGSGLMTIHNLIFSLTGTTISGINFFAGTGSGTFNHGLGFTPQWIGITDNSAGGSQTEGVASIGSTTCVVTTGSGHAWKGIAIG